MQPASVSAILKLLTSLATTFSSSATNVTFHHDDNSRERKRRLLINDFVPLSCNNGLREEDCVAWSENFGNATEFLTQVVVDCGTCVIIDLSNDRAPTGLILRSGLQVLGKLVIADFGEKFLNIQTPSIVVQGELEISSTQPIDGTPRIHVGMIGSDPQTFLPVGENSGKCVNEAASDDEGCPMDHRAITVAGGKIKLQGIGDDVKTWVPLVDVAGGTFKFPTILVVEAAGIQGYWKPGAEILVTSHTRTWNDHQVRRIVAVTASSEGLVELHLDDAIRRPTTRTESPDFAVEVALLSRNILLEGGPNPQDGGHMWVYQTPTIEQSIVGVEFRRFGQQGKLGRYPIHFHHCGDVTDSVVEKNLVRHSHQRCIVVHGTNNLLVRENVAYQTAGHCIVTEDGIETGNQFLGNLAAETSAPETLISRDETDNQPASFWISNPTNTLQGNVAAGCEGSGYWYELKKRGPLASLFPDPISEPLGEFDGNVAHSNGNSGKPTGSGAIRLYPHGFLPNGSTKEVFSGVKAYRNIGIGIFIHKVHNFHLADSLVSDCDIGIDLDRAEDVNVVDTTVLGMSQSYSDLMTREPETEHICGRRGITTGLDLHSWRLRGVEGGFSIRGVVLSGYNEIDCSSVSAIRMDPFSVIQGGFEVYTEFSDVVVFDGPEFISFCEAEASDMNGVYFMDLDGSVSPSLSTAASTGAIVSDNVHVTSFVNQDLCTRIEKGCYQYCRESCFNSFRLDINSAGTEGITLEVCVANDSGHCIILPSSKRHDKNNPYGDFPRSFLVHLPPGSYYARFVDPSGTETWPAFVDKHLEKTYCSPEAVVLGMTAPPLSANECSEIVKNGDVDAPSVDPLFWQTAYPGRLELGVDVGVDNSNALSGRRYGRAKILQYIDPRCLMTNSAFRITARAKLVNEDGAIALCDPDAEHCPYAGISADCVDIDIAQLQVDAGVDDEGYQTLDGVGQVDVHLNQGCHAYLYIIFPDNNRSLKGTRKLFVDNVLMIPVLAPTEPTGEPPTYRPSSVRPTSTPTTGADGSHEWSTYQPSSQPSLTQTNGIDECSSACENLQGMEGFFSSQFGFRFVSRVKFDAQGACHDKCIWEGMVWMFTFLGYNTCGKCGN